MKIAVNILGWLEYQRLAWIALLNPRKAWDQMTQAIKQAEAENLYFGLKDHMKRRAR